VLDPAGYGAVTITKSISIIDDGVGEAGVQAASGADAITINAGANDIVRLRGLTIDGAGVASSGIAFYSGASLEIVNCVVRHFMNFGIKIEPSTAPSKYLVSNTIVSANSIGILVQASGITGVISKVTANNNFDGIVVGWSPIMIANSVLSNNIYTGLGTEIGAIVRLAQSVISGNGTGVALGGGTVYSYHDNYIDGNTNGVTGGSLTTSSMQ
jgi:hypothetical protein